MLPPTAYETHRTAELSRLPDELRNMITRLVAEQRDLKDKQLRNKVNRLNLLHALTSAGFMPRDEIDAPDLGVTITVRESPEYKRLDRQKLLDLGVDPEIIAAASITVPSKLHFRIGGINAGIT